MTTHAPHVKIVKLIQEEEDVPVLERDFLAESQDESVPGELEQEVSIEPEHETPTNAQVVPMETVKHTPRSPKVFTFKEKYNRSSCVVS